jgi:ABC-type branched-subunit amino acid transport system substrate-binding protein
MRKRLGLIAGTVATALVATFAGAGAAPAQPKKFDGTIKIGANAELSGFDQVFGQSQLDGMEFAAKDINKGGGIEVDGKSYKLEIVAKDNRSDPTGSVQASRELVDEGVIASSASNNSFPASYEIQKPTGMLIFGGTPLLALQIMTPEGLARNPTLFSVIPFSTQVFTNWVPQIESLFPKIEKLGILIEDEALAGPLVASIETAASDAGWEVVATERFRPGTTDFSTQLTRLRDAGPDIVFTGRVPVHNVPATQQAAQLDVAPYLWTFTGIPSDLGDLDEFEGRTLIFSEFASTVGPGATIPSLKKGEKKLNKAFGDELLLPEITMALYNFTQLVAAAIEKAQTTTDGAAVSKAMEGLTYSGPFGDTGIDPGHFQDHATQQIVRRNGKTTVYVYNSITEEEPAEKFVIKK